MECVLGEVIRAQKDRPTERKIDEDVVFILVNFHFIEKSQTLP